MREPMVHLVATDIAKRFRNRTLFRDVSMELMDGETVAVTGSNGSGKSTLLRILGGLLRPSAGTVTMKKDGREVDPEFLSLEFGYVAPASSVYSAMTGLENIEFLQSFYSGVEVDPAELLDRVGLTDAGDRQVGEYSSGMLQRIKLACALVGDPAILLLDEPYSNLDTKGCDLVKDVIRSQQERGRPVVVATNVHTHANDCDRILHIEDYQAVDQATQGS